jgi:GNAT superfamily N-acetyltransferase
MIRRLEALSANAWPGLRSVLVDGWILRFAEGYSRRANSVLPLYEGVAPLAERIARCEALARVRGVEPTFKLTTAALPGELDAELERRGYVHTAATSVMVLERLQAKAPGLPKHLRAHVSERLEDAWFAFYASSGGLDGRQAAAARAIMEHIVPVRRFLLVEGEDGPAACALAVVEDGWAGVFDVAVRKDLRGQGLGRRIMEITLAEAAAAGAARSYLQVVAGNRPAEELYRRLGYSVAYPYWYRVKQATP